MQSLRDKKSHSCISEARHFPRDRKRRKNKGCLLQNLLDRNGRQDKEGGPSLPKDKNSLLDKGQTGLRSQTRRKKTRLQKPQGTAATPSLSQSVSQSLAS